jgi:hypothetical protein
MAQLRNIGRMVQLRNMGREKQTPYFLLGQLNRNPFGEIVLGKYRSGSYLQGALLIYPFPDRQR